MSKYNFKSLDGTGVINCDSLDLVRPFKVKREIQFDLNKSTVVNTTYHVRICSAGTTTEQLYQELDKAMQVSEETYNQIIKLKQTWCEHQVLTGKMSPFEVTPGMCPKQVPDQLEEFLLKTMGRKDWPTDGNPIHWLIDINDEDWFNELAHLGENEKFSEEKGDFTEINFVPDNYINISGWRGNVMFTLPLYPEKEKPVYTLKEGIKKISEFIIAGKIKIPGLEYN